MADQSLPPVARCPHCDGALGIGDLLLMTEICAIRNGARLLSSPAAAAPPRQWKAFVVPSAALEWLRTGERGISSEVIFERLTGIPVQNGSRKDVPSDPDDLRRCRLLLDAVPEFGARLEEMADVSERWAKLVKVWNRLCAIMDEETAARERWRGEGQHGPAPIWKRTWAAMGRLLYGQAPVFLRHLPDELATTEKADDHD